MVPMIPTDPILNRLLTTAIQLAMLSFDIFMFKAIWACEKEDPFIIPETWTHPELRAKRRRARVATNRRPTPRVSETRVRNVPLCQVRRDTRGDWDQTHVRMR